MGRGGWGGGDDFIGKNGKLVVCKSEQRMGNFSLHRKLSIRNTGCGW